MEDEDFDKSFIYEHVRIHVQPFSNFKLRCLLTQQGLEFQCNGNFLLTIGNLGGILELGVCKTSCF